jgi:stearoyl-CoA desaturase (delta-9 desaturase)
MSFYGVFNHMPWWGYIVYTLVVTHITMISITIFLHRAQAHRALDLHPAVAHFFRFWLWLTTGMKTKEWVAVHRKHHAKCETIDDPHSPVVEGIATVLLEGAELYRYAKKDPETLEKYGKGTPSDWLEKHVYSTSFMRGKQGVVALYLLSVILFGVPGIIIWGIQMIWTPFFAAGIINGIGHYFGYRNFECPDAARNIFPIGILVAGEELHNNHHTYGNSAKLSVHWWEFDIGWMYIKLLSYCGLAKPKRLPPEVCRKSRSGAGAMDLANVEAIINNKIAVFSEYTRKVIKPVFNRMKKDEASCEKIFCAKTKKLILRNPALNNQDQQEHITAALNDARDLQVVCSYRDRLNQIWSKTASSNKELTEAFQDWCRQAEKSGIDALQKFAPYIKAYRLKKKSI